MRLQTLELLLRVAEAGRQGVPMTVLHRTMSERSLSSISRGIASLMEGCGGEGLVLLEEDPRDRRHKIVYLSSAGERFVDRLCAAVAGGSKR